MTGITAFICTKDEEANIAECVACVEGVDEVVIADGGSTDRTQKVAESLGATFFRREPFIVTVSSEDIVDFACKFGWRPEFTAGQVIMDGDKEYMEALTHCKNDWVVTPDADERVYWDLPKLRELMAGADHIECPFSHYTDEEGNPQAWGKKIKLTKRSLTTVVGRVHTAVLTQGKVESVAPELMRIEHHRDPAKPQGYVLPALEYSALKDDAQRWHFYLAREYYYRGRYDDAIELFRRYLAVATWPTEIGQARLHRAACYWESGRGEEARADCLEAILINPDHKTALQMYAEMHYEPWRSKWQKIADNATDQDILY